MTRTLAAAVLLAIVPAGALAAPLGGSAGTAGKEPAAHASPAPVLKIISRDPAAPPPCAAFQPWRTTLTYTVSPGRCGLPSRVRG